MNTEEQQDLASKVDTLRKKYGEGSISPSQNSQRRNICRINSGVQSFTNLNMRQLQKHFFKSSKDILGGGINKRSLIGTSFPSLRTREKQITEINQPYTKREISVSLVNLDQIGGIQSLLGSNHHCHFEIQVKHLNAQLEASEIQRFKAKEELESVIWMVKNYNNEGLIAQLLNSQQMRSELEFQLQQMRKDIEMLGNQRDDWQIKYEEIYEKLLKMQGVENDLNDALHELQMSNESLVQINKRLREKQIEVQDWQRKCNTHDEQYKIRINKLEEIQKEKEIYIQQLQKKLQGFDSENVKLEKEMKIKTEKLEEEQRRSKQLYAELLDTRVNKVQNLQDEIVKQKKVIQQRVEEIEEQEKKNKLLNNKLNLLETQLKNFDDVARQEKEELEKGWQKKYKELEKQNVQNKRDLNQLEIQLQQVDLLIQQKDQEVEQTVLKLKELSDINEKQLQTIQTNSIEIHRLNKELEEKDQELQQAEQQNEELSQERTSLIKRIDLQSNEISDLKQQAFLINKQLEALKLENKDQQRQLERLNEQIIQINQASDQYKQQLDEEIKKTFQLYSEINKLKQDIQDLQIQYQKEKESQSKVNQDKDEKIKQLQKSLQDYEINDQDLGDKLKRQTIQHQQKENQIQQLQNEKKELELKIQDIQQQLSQQKILTNELEKEKQEYLQRIKDIQIDKTEFNNEIEKLKAEFESKQKNDGMQNIANQFNSEERNQLESQKNELQVQLSKTADELQEWKNKYLQLEIVKNNSDSQYKQLKDSQEQEKKKYLRKIEQLKNKINKLKDKLQEAKEEIDNLSNIVPKQVYVPINKNNTYHQIFIEDQVYSQDSTNEEIVTQFSQIDFSRSKGHITICFWVKINKINSKEILPILTISTENKKLLEMGVYLDSKQVYSTFFPNNHPKITKQQNPITVTSQMSIRLGEFQLLALILNESGQYMDMGLCLNGVRDDQVSILTSLIFPEAYISFGKYSIHPLVLKDCLIITQNQQKINLCKEIYQSLYYQYNGIKKINRKYQQKKENVSPKSAGDLIFYLIQQNEQSPQNSGSRSKSPQQNQGLIPVKLRNELLNYQMKTEETKPEEIQDQLQWCRMYSTKKLRKFLNTNLNYKRFLNPFNEYYDFISLGLQLLEPPRNDEQPPTKFHKKIKPKIQLSPYYMMSYKQFLNYIESCGFQHINGEEFHKLCEQIEVIYTYNKEEYIHYDHFLIILNKCLMPRVDSNKKKQQPKDESYCYKEIFIQSSGKRENEVQNSNAIEVTQISINKNEQKIQLVIKLKNESLKIQSLDSFPEAQIGTINLNQLKKMTFLFTHNSLINEIKTETHSILFGQQSENALSCEVELQENEKIIHFFIENDKQINLIVQIKRRQIESISESESDSDVELEQKCLPQLPDNWNLGKFYVNIGRCSNCVKHQQTTRHQEKDFIDKKEYLENILKEQFPNVEIIENEDKTDQLEYFEVYLKNVQLDGQKQMLFQKQESMKQFKEKFNEKLPKLFEELMKVINRYGTTEKLGQEQEKFR